MRADEASEPDVASAGTGPSQRRREPRCPNCGDVDWWVVARQIVAGEPPGTPLAQHQPREHPVPCQGCRAMTWNRSALCGACERTEDALAQAKGI
jgi:hypothetical protein